MGTNDGLWKYVKFSDISNSRNVSLLNYLINSVTSNYSVLFIITLNMLEVWIYNTRKAFVINQAINIHWVSQVCFEYHPCIGDTLVSSDHSNFNICAPKVSIGQCFGNQSIVGVIQSTDEQYKDLLIPLKYIKLIY